MRIFHAADRTATSADARDGEPSWRRDLAHAIRDVPELLRAVGLEGDAAASLTPDFPLVATRSFVRRMRRGDAHDPLLRQVLPLSAEDDLVPGFGIDPIGEADATARPGLLHKYDGRVLVVATSTCAIHCRYCFRRHFPYGEAPRGRDAIDECVDYVRADPTIHEVLLSGGDPLLLSDGVLDEWSARLAAVPHLRRLRIHSRLPIVLPSRVDDGLLGWIERTRAAGVTPWIVVHANHAAELVGDCADALGRLVDAGVPVLNQAVLLRGVNDDEDALAELCERLVDLRVQPYYLHQLDPVAGAAHFHVEETRGLELVAALRRRLPGYAVPRYVREDAGEAHKTDLA